MPPLRLTPHIRNACTPHAHPMHHTVHHLCTPRALALQTPCQPPVLDPCEDPRPQLSSATPPPFRPQGGEACVALPSARPHRGRRRLLRRLCSEHHKALHGEQAGGGRPRRRLPAAVAADAPGLQHPRGTLDEAARRGLHPALHNWQREHVFGHRFDGARHRDAQRSPDRTPGRDGTRRDHVL